jgi:hypothetical protein
MLYVLCPNTQTPVQQDGRDVQFERLADVPDEILCENESGEPQRNATKGNAWLRVNGLKLVPVLKGSSADSI